ncbi:MAG: hypothetical protein WAK17_22780 [Candidatus Nitrosopolaris sp.]
MKEFDSFMKSFGVIKISLVSPIKSISLELWNTYGNNKPIYSITSNDSDWSRNIRSKITDVLEKYQTHYDFLHSRKSWLIWMTFGIIVMIVDLYFQPPKTIFATVGAIAIPWGVAYSCSVFIRWLFPRLEVDNAAQIRFRGWILTGFIGGITAALIGGLLLSLFR